jgi:hypothetical protein
MSAGREGVRRYAERDIVKQGQPYCDHVSAMTVEGLHAKSAIAAELAHRDIEIATLTAELGAMRASVRGACELIELYFSEAGETNPQTRAEWMQEACEKLRALSSSVPK